MRGQRKKGNKSFYNPFFTREEVRHQKEIKVGSLEEEIRISKIILRRYLTEHSNDIKYLKGLMDILNTIRGLERDHKEITGASGLNATSTHEQMVQAAKETDISIVPIVEEEGAPDVQ